MMDSVGCTNLSNHDTISLRGCSVSSDDRVVSSQTPATMMVAVTPSMSTKNSESSVPAVLETDITATTLSKTSVPDFKAQLEVVQQQLYQLKAENAAKDRTIDSLRQQMQIQEQIIQQLQQQQQRHPQTQTQQEDESDATINKMPGLDPKLGKFFRSNLFDPNQHNLSLIQDDVNDELRTFFEEKFRSMQQDAIGKVEDGEHEYNDDDDGGDDESSSVLSGSEVSFHSRFSSRSSSFSTLQRQCLERLGIQTRNDSASSHSNETFSSGFGHTSATTATNNILGSSGVCDIVGHIQRWLFLEGGYLRDVPSLLTEYCNFCRTHCDLPHLDRLFVAGMMLPPQMSAYIWQWEHGKDFVEKEIPHSAFEEPNYDPDEPLSILMEGRAMEYRIKAHQKQTISSGCAWFTEENYQDYLALPIYFRGEFVGAMAWATKNPCGFSDQDIHVFYESLGAMSTVLRIHTNDIVMNTLQERLDEHIKIQIRDLAEANHRLAVSNARVMKQAQDQLKHFAMMSHEIRTPLNGIIGLSNLLLDDPERPLDPEVRESISVIIASGDLLLAVVDDVLDYSKLASGNVEIEIGPTNIRRTVEPVVESIRVKAASISKDHKLELRSIISDDLPEYVDLDGRRLQQILYNLLGNAVKFGKRGRFVDFSVTIMPADTDISSEEEATNERNESNKRDMSMKSDSMLVFSIKDYGKGIAKKDMKTIFQPFQQSSSNDAADGGTGLGLAITSQLCKVMGGKIMVTSEEGKWSDFVVQLPLIISKEDSVRGATRQCDLKDEVVGIGDKRLEFRNSLHSRSSRSTRFTPSLLSEFHGSKRSFYTSPTVSPVSSLQRSKSENTLSDLPEAPFLSPGDKRQTVFNPQDWSATSPPGNPSPGSTEQQQFTRTIQDREPAGNLAAAAAAPSNVSPFDNLRVLIAEDNLVNQKVLTRTLMKLGMTKIDVVQNGQEAVDVSAGKPFDIIFMDWCMPVLDGLQATQQIVARHKKNPLGVHPRIVFLTAHALDDYREKAHEAGGDGFISKPFKIAAIKKFLEQHMPMQPQGGPEYNGMFT
ncbi:multi-sensor hybrid histidine kinase [Nitzschia inconspicua]|uniref:histidine kinase n=1 Tax=Nitzschia inconspicua TaxID=303405 RepID=A0A9K3KGQ8_9STRA|nr:multi-sensor hybrid histidine kinase [Nitzschia inconspicua]